MQSVSQRAPEPNVSSLHRAAKPPGGRLLGLFKGFTEGLVDAADLSLFVRWAGSGRGGAAVAWSPADLGHLAPGGSRLVAQGFTVI